MWHIYIHTQWDEIMLFAATWMDLEIIIRSEVRQRKTNTIWHPVYMDSKENDTNELIYRTKIDSRTEKTNLSLPKGKGGGGINYEFGINRYTLL